jgi:hypothetical protein
MTRLRVPRGSGAVFSGVLALAYWARPAHAAPQWDTGLVASGCLLGDADAAFERVAFCGQARADLLLFRQRTSDFGLGPYLALGSAAFEDLRVSGGVTALLPVVEDFPVVLSVGALARDGGDIGLASSVFWGLRSYNFHGGYNLAFGLSLAGERTFGAQPSNALSLGFQVDGLVLALPFLLLVGAAQ